MSLSDRRRGQLLIVIGVGVMLLYTGVTAAVAPSANPATERADGRTLVGAMGTSDDGRVTMHAKDGSVEWEYGNAFSYNDVQQLDNGSVLASFQVRAHECGPYKNPCMRTGVRIIEPDPQPHVVWSWTYPTRDGLNAELHDAEVLADRGEVLMVGMDRERVFTVDMTTEEITWQWNASQHYSPPPDPTRTDWLHMNDVDRIGQGRYLVSVRNANQILILNRSCTCITELINRDGNPDVLYEQHNPQWLGEGRVLVADSENHRIVELERTDDGDWKPVWTVYGAGGTSFEWPRDADRLPNGNTLVVDTLNQRVVEIDSEGDLVWQTTTHGQPYDAERRGQEYPAGPQTTSQTDGVYNKQWEQPFEPVNYLYAGLVHQVAVPRWMSAWHILVSLVCLPVAGTGAYVWIVALYRRRRTGDGDRCSQCGGPLSVKPADPAAVGCARCERREYNCKQVSD